MPRILRLFISGALIFLSGSLVLATVASAQTISQLVNAGNAGFTNHGQSFTATQAGVVTQIQVRPRATLPSTVYFFNGPGSGTDNSNATAISSQPVNLVDTGNNNTGFQTIVLDTPLPVVAGQQYSFAFSGFGVFATGFNPYADGTVISAYNTPQAGFDMVFTVTESTPLPPAPVPTLSEWAMILFGLILAGGAALYIQRRQMIA